jgi:hypothetical protein
VATKQQDALKFVETMVAIDNGNSHVKVVYDSLDQYFSFPDLISKPIGEQDSLLRLSGDPLNLLEIKISSPALEGDKFSHVFVGKRAMRDRNNNIMEITGDRAKVSKAERPETIVTILAGVACAVAKKAEADIKAGCKRIRAKVGLGVGLPISEYTLHSEKFAAKLTGVHTVTFGETPIYKGTTIELDISLPSGVAIDDVSAAIDIDTTSKTKLSTKRFGIADIGGVDMDVCFFREDLELDLLNPYAAKINLNDALENIRRRVNSDKIYLHSIAELVDRIMQQDYEIIDRGKVIDMRPVITEHLTGVGQRAFDIIMDAWGNVTYAREFWLVGGGAVILHPYIEKANVEKAPIYFDDFKLSQFRNVRGTFMELYAVVNTSKETAVAKDE